MSIEARVHFLPTSDGGLLEPMPSPCQSFLFRLDGSSADLGVRIASKSGDAFAPGRSEVVTMTFWTDGPEVERVQPGARFALRYPNRVVATGAVEETGPS